MDRVALVKLALTTSVLLLVFALGMRASPADIAPLFRGMFRRPHRLVRAMVAMYVVVPVVAAVAAKELDLPVPVAATLLAMSVAPIPPILPGKQLKFGGKPDYVFGLLVAMSFAAMLIAPLAAHWLGSLFGREVSFRQTAVAQQMVLGILAPLLAGMLVRHFAARIATAMVNACSTLGTVLLVAGLVPVLVKAWPAMASLGGGGTLLVILAVVAAAMAAGHLLGGPDPDERTALAVASAVRHPGVALGIATLAVPDEPRVGAAVLLYLLIASVATRVYGGLRTRGEGRET